MSSLDADETLLALFQACALREGSVVNENPLSRAIQRARLLLRGSRSPLLPRNNVH